MPKKPNDVPEYQILTCGVCGTQVNALYAIDRMAKMIEHWKRAKHYGIPYFDRTTWEQRMVVDNV